MRIECTVEERAIWVDLLSLASKDDGYIRANEETPYPIEQLAGMLMVPQKTLAEAIEKFINLKDKEGKGKLTRTKYGTLYITKWDKYQFSDRWKREIEKNGSAKTEGCSEKSAPIVKNNTLNDNKVEDIITLTKEFDEFWEIYNLKTAKKDAIKAFLALRRKGVDFKTIKEAVKGYAAHLKNEAWKKQKYPAGFLRNEFWKDFIGVTHEPEL